jgi:hypothetical protein
MLPGSGRRKAWLASLSLAAAFGCEASCGSAYCTLMTDRYAQGAGEPHLGWSGELRLEQVTQDRLRSGTHRIDASEVTDEEAIERRTRNLNLFTTLGYGFNEAWSVSLSVPALRRDHQHDLFDEGGSGATTPERWRFTRLGDVQVLARRQALLADAATSYALFGGFKLPTGTRSIVNADGARAERSLQPGTGTTDVLLGVAARRALSGSDALFGQATVAHALNSREAFKPGTRLDLAGGWSHAFSERLGAVLQLNLRKRGRDKGEQAEPDNSGSTRLDLSPGLTVATGAASTLYGYLQVPVYQHVNGIQLVPRYGFAAGWTKDF